MPQCQQSADTEEWLEDIGHKALAVVMLPSNVEGAEQC
jgi:hypothetical protein